MRIKYPALALSAIGLMLAADTPFEKKVQPVLSKTCAPCHNETMASGGLNVAAFLDPKSITQQRDGWERIIQKMRTGEMPPKGIPRPAAQIDDLTKFVQAEFERADKLVKPDPGRVRVPLSDAYCSSPPEGSRPPRVNR